MARKMTRVAELSHDAERCGIYVRTYSPGDGITRYRFFDKPGNSYFGPDNGIYTALGMKEARGYVQSFCASRGRRSSRSS